MLPYLAGIARSLIQEHRSVAWNHAHRATMFRRFVAGAQTVPGVKERLNGTTTLTSITDITPITKSEMMTDFGRHCAEWVPSRAVIDAHIAAHAGLAGAEFGPLVACTTSGSTGEVGLFVNKKRDWDELSGFAFGRILRWPRLRPSQVLRFVWGRRYRMAIVAVTDGPYATALAGFRRPALGRLIVDARLFDLAEPAAALQAGLASFRPHYVHAYPSALSLLMHANPSGTLPELEAISLGSERVSPAFRTELRARYPGVDVLETYGATECLAIASQCPAGALHVNEDVCYVEPVDADRQPVAAGNFGEAILLTNFLSSAQPILRYQIDDRVRLLLGACACGSPFQRLEIEGRRDDNLFLTAVDGTERMHTPVPWETLFLGVDGVASYQLRHIRQNVLEARIVLKMGASAEPTRLELRRRMGQYLTRAELSQTVSFTVDFVAEIERGPGGKHKQIVDLVKAPVPAIQVQ